MEYIYEKKYDEDDDKQSAKITGAAAAGRPWAGPAGGRALTRLAASMKSRGMKKLAPQTRGA